MKKFLPVLIITLVVLGFFWKFFLQGLLPIPSDTIVGLYHPFRDLYVENYPSGIPFKNFLISDPIRQTYPWRELSISILKKIEMPFWNPYTFSGTPLIGNMQSAPFYPLNVLFFIFPFSFSWSILILLQPLLAGIFIYCFLNNLRLNRVACFIGGIIFGFSGFFIAWLEWGTIGHVVLWLPLILLSIDKIFEYYNSLKISNIKYSPRGEAGQILNIHIKNKKLINWGLIFIFSLMSSFLAGHLQIFFYLFLFVVIYFIVRWFQYGKKFNVLSVFLIFNILFLILTSIQWIPTLQFIIHSARNIDYPGWQKAGWFIPWQHLIQFVAPDFFGNPSTLNYWGEWNYGELVGYIGILPLIMAMYALFFRRDKKTFFFGTVFFVTLIFALENPIARIPYFLNLPFLTTSQPTRLIAIIDFSLAVLAVFGLDYFFNNLKKNIFYPFCFLVAILIGLWSIVFFGNKLIGFETLDNILIAKRNLIFPSIMLFVTGMLLIFLVFFKRFIKSFTIIIYIIIVGVVIFDLFRFGWKFTPFTKQEYLFPNTKVISYLKKNLGNYRYMTTDSRIFPPNFSSIYRLQSVDGYDPLYLRRYGELIAASERGEPNISPPFGFNRIVTPKKYNSKIMDLLGVKYILSLSDLYSPKLKKVFQEGQTKIYENRNVLPRAFFVSKRTTVNNKLNAINVIFNESLNLKDTAVVEGLDIIFDKLEKWEIGDIEFVNYSENKVVLETGNVGEGFMVLTDSYYPNWRAKIDGNETKIYRTNYNFRGIAVPSGKHKIEFYINLL